MDVVDTAIAAVVIGIGATAFMDAFAWLQRYLFKIPSLNYALVGRWIIGLLTGQFFHNTILQSPPQRNERAIGWLFHYSIGVFFVLMMLFIIRTDWYLAPDLLNPLLIGVLSLCAPFFVMQPAFGFGVAASKTPSPWVARQRSLIAHLSFGVGIYVAGVIWLHVTSWY
ncbi:DUF2938 domain-containing protein [Loktanella sp. F6476L]|uniref:DUF2938 domain-containing protein n=1 Tax=Loktanella sp. F6476L TaxID=2926405 RepID=UPI001FF1DF89|nr:DUF2938 domain-containing protein [Loktanella sp. F6476L]MCK0118901.1 DUF2938 domain-containing protein [Loktanella sp. F6476L]